VPDGSQPAGRQTLPRNSLHPLVNLPNIITFGRLCAVPVAVWLVLRMQFVAAFWLFVAASVSDAVDGWLARRRGSTTVGALLDPVADKVLLVAMYITLAAVRVLPDWLAILVVFRDLVIVGGVLALSVLGLPVEIRPLFISKVNTTLQIMLVAVALLLTGTGLSWPMLLVLVWLVTATTLISGAAYVWQAGRGR